MPFADSFPVRARGPKSDLCVAYLSATVNAGTVTRDDTKTSSGFTISNLTSGVGTITFPKCRFLTVISARLNPATLATVSEYRIVNVDELIDATGGTFNFNLATHAAPPVVGNAAATNNELSFTFLMGF